MAHIASLTERLYGDVDFVEERHRHRYEVNPKLVDELEAAGLSFVGRDETGERMEITELKGMPLLHMHACVVMRYTFTTRCGLLVLLCAHDMRMCSFMILGNLPHSLDLL